VDEDPPDFDDWQYFDRWLPDQLLADDVDFQHLIDTAAKLKDLQPYVIVDVEGKAKQLQNQVQHFKLRAPENQHLYDVVELTQQINSFVDFCTPSTSFWRNPSDPEQKRFFVNAKNNMKVGLFLIWTVSLFLIWTVSLFLIWTVSLFFWYRLSVYCTSNFPGLYLCLFRCLYLALRSASKWARTQTILTETKCIFNDLLLSPTGPINWAGSALLAVIFQIPTVIRLVRSVVSGSWRCGPVFVIN